MNQLTKQERSRAARAFAAAKPFLWNGVGRFNSKELSGFICCALDIAPIPEADANLAQRIISERLNGCATVQGWLCKHGYISGMYVNFQQVQEYRHLWLDSLIKEFSA